MFSSGRDEVIPCATASPFTKASVSPQFAVIVCGVGPVAVSEALELPKLLASANPANASEPTTAAIATSRLDPGALLR